MTSAQRPVAQPVRAWDVELRVLGPLQVLVDGTEVTISSRRQRALLVLLSIDLGRVLPADVLIERLWDGTPPPQATVTLRSYVSNLRAALGGRPGPGDVLATRGQGYLLDLPGSQVDAVRLQRLVEDGRRQLRAGRPEAALASFSDAARLWRGTPLAEIADSSAALSTAAQLTELRLGGEEGRLESLVAAGRHLDAVAGLEAFTAEHPLRETPRALLMLALYRSGRAPEALEVARRFRGLLREELGLDPSGHLEQLAQQILEQDPGLEPPLPPVVVPAEEQLARGEPTRPAPPALPGPVLLGRQRELALIERQLDRLVDRGQGGLLLVGGEPGIGKSTLLEAAEHRARLRGAATYAGRSPAAAGAPAFWPWSQVLDAVAGALTEDELRAACTRAARPVGQLSPAVAERLGVPAPVTGDNPQTLRFLLYEAVAVFLRNVHGDRPVLICLDDLHWADLPTLELVSYLTPFLAERPLLILAAYRDLPADRSPALEATLATVSREEVVEELHLTGLDEDAVAALAVELVGGSRDAGTTSSFAAVLHARTGGNPFFVRQLGRLLLESPGGLDDAARTVVPPGVRHVITSRLAGLGSTTLRLLEAAAVLGREFDLAVAAAAAAVPLPEALDACDHAAARGLVEAEVAGAQYRFVHALVQEVLVDGLGPGRAAQLHAAVAVELERVGAPPGEIAEHMWRGRALLRERAVPYLVSAGEQAARVFAHDQAEHHLRRALDLLQHAVPHDPRAELQVLLALFRLISVDRGWGAEDARAVVVRARELAEAGGLRSDDVRLWWSLWLFLLDHGDESSTADVARTVERALSESEDAAAAVASQVMSFFTALAEGDESRAEQHLAASRRAVERSSNEALDAFDEHLHVMVLLIEAHLAALAHDAEAHRSAAEAAIALADANGRPFPRAVARTLGALSAPFAAQPSYVRELARQALDLDQRFGFGWLVALASAVDAWATCALDGPSHDEMSRIEDAVRMLREGNHLGNLSIALYLLADAQATAGRMPEALATFAESRTVPGGYGLLMQRRLDERLAAASRGS